MPKVSIIIPVYGVEEYIERCARSLFEQTLDDLEYIFVDDCTKDNSINVLENTIKAYPERRAQVIIVHHDQNMGLPLARKTGIKVAKGEYIAHCDSDDWVDVNTYETLYNYAKKKDLDLVIFGFERTTGEKVISRQDPIYNNIYNDRHLLISALLQGKDLSSLWNKFLKRDLYLDQDFVYPSLNMWEDYPCVFQFFIKAKKIGAIPETYYKYFHNSKSICGVSNPELIRNRLKQLMANVGIIEDLSKRYGVYKEYKEDLISLKYKAKSELLPIVNIHKYWKEWLCTYSDINSRILFTNTIPFREKMKFLVILTGLYPFCKKKSNW